MLPYQETIRKHSTPGHWTHTMMSINKTQEEQKQNCLLFFSSLLHSNFLFLVDERLLVRLVGVVLPIIQGLSSGTFSRHRGRQVNDGGEEQEEESGNIAIETGS